MTRWLEKGIVVIRKLLVGAAMATAFVGGQAQAVTFNLVNTGGAEAGTRARLGFDIAAAYWSSVLTNDSVVNLEIGFESLGAGILGSTGSNRADISLATVQNALRTTGNSAIDRQAMTTLDGQITKGSISAITNGPSLPNGDGVDTRTLEWDDDGSQNNSYIYGNTSLYRAIGLTTNEYTGESFADDIDGSVTFSSNFSFDFDPTDGLTANSFDFIGVAVHEIGHALGFVSGVDLYDIYGGPYGPYASENGFSFDNPGGGLMSVLDLFRYSADVRDVAPGSGPVLDWSVTDANTIALGGNPYFSIDGGATQLFGDSRYSTGSYNGDGQQASHWKDKGGCTGQIGIMDPNFCRQQDGEVTGSDLAAFDAMGWNVNFNVLGNPNYVSTTADMYRAFAGTVPEPSTWAMMIGGFGIVGGAMRRRRSTTTVTFA
jgi:hypothetical protein